MEDFYRELNPDLAALADRGKYNFGIYWNRGRDLTITDHPDSIDFELLEKTIMKIVNQEPVDIPQYDFIHHRRYNLSWKISPSKTRHRDAYPGS